MFNTQMTILNIARHWCTKISYSDVNLSTHYLIAGYLKTEVGVFMNNSSCVFACSSIIGIKYLFRFLFNTFTSMRVDKMGGTILKVLQIVQIYS